MCNICNVYIRLVIVIYSRVLTWTSVAFMGVKGGKIKTFTCLLEYCLKCWPPNSASSFLDLF